MVLGDETSLRSLFDILLDNAFKYTPTPGSVHLTLEPTNEGATIAVQDTGPGIAEPDQSRIFERFYRIDQARTRNQGGAGLGLSIAHWIAVQHHGSITVDSQPGHGATFRVGIPSIAVRERPLSAVTVASTQSR